MVRLYSVSYFSHHCCDISTLLTGRIDCCAQRYPKCTNPQATSDETVGAGPGSDEDVVDGGTPARWVYFAFRRVVLLPRNDVFAIERII